MRRAVLAAFGLVLAVTPEAGAERRGPILHEPIAPDPREDVALSVALDGELPAAIQTPHGAISAPDPERPIGGEESPYSASPPQHVPDAQFHPDRDTRRPDVLPYDDPFSPSTAPFKRLSAYDAVDASYTLSVRDPHTATLPVSMLPPPSAQEELFYADMVIELATGRKVRIPSVGPGARVLRARAGIGTQDVPFTLHRDGAENWFIESTTAGRVRLVMQLSIPRAAFGGDFGNPSWAELPPASPLPSNAEGAAAEVAARIGVSRAMPPRAVVTKLVSYFRGFAEADEPPKASRDIYLDLALSQKGVCRHRAFAFLVTALHLRLPTRMIANEAHAWVELHDGRIWRRIDLGGAGRTLSDPLSSNVPYEPPPDPFMWPQGSTRGTDLANRARRPPPPGPADGDPQSAPSSAPSGLPAPPPGSDPRGAFAPPSAQGADDPRFAAGGPLFGPGGALSVPGRPTPKPQTLDVGPDDRPRSTVVMTAAAPDARRGAPFPLRGQVYADGEPCGHVTVDVVLRGRAIGNVAIGQLATDERGNYEGALVMPQTLPLGDYEVWGYTLGDARCGVGKTK